MTPLNRGAKHGTHMPYRAPSSGTYGAKPRIGATPRPMFVGMPPVKNFLMGSPQKGLLNLQKNLRPTPPPVSSKSLATPSTAEAPKPAATKPSADYKPKELGEAQKNIRRLAASKDPQHHAIAVKGYEGIVKKIEASGSHGMDKAANSTHVRGILAGGKGVDATSRLQASLVALGKGHYLGNFGTAGIDGKRGFFTNQAVARIKQEMGFKSEADILAAAQKKLAA